MGSTAKGNNILSNNKKVAYQRVANNFDRYKT